MQVLEIAVENKKDSFAQEPAQEERLASIGCVSAREGTHVLR